MIHAEARGRQPHFPSSGQPAERPVAGTIVASDAAV